MMQRHKKNIEPTCSICHFPFDAYYHNPRILPKCGHTFCEKCLTTNLQTKGNRKVFICIECGSDSVIRKNVGQEFPKNIMILDVLKDMRRRTLSNNGSVKPQSPKSTIRGKECQQHSKPLQLECQTCKNQAICSHCAIFGRHKNHIVIGKNAQRDRKLTSNDVQELEKTFLLLQGSIQNSLLPNSPNNILSKSKVSMEESLHKVIKMHFRKYYQPIQKREQQMLSQCGLIEIEGHVMTTIDRILNDYQFLKLKYQNCAAGNKQQVGLIADHIIDSALKLHQDLQNLVNHVEQQVSKHVNEIADKINSMIAFRVQEIPFTIKSIKKLQKNNITVPGNTSQDNRKTKSPQISRIGKQDLKKSQKSVLVEKPKQNMGSFINDEKMLSQFRFEEGVPSQSRFVSDLKYDEGSNISARDEIIEITGFPEQDGKIHNTSKPHTDTSSSLRERLTPGSRTPTKSRLSQKIEFTKSRKDNQKNELPPFPNTPRNNKKQHPPLGVGTEKVDLKYTRPSKEINYELRPKLQQLCGQIDRQHHQGSGNSLQLIGMDVNDTLLWHLVDYMRNRKLQFSTVKFVKNGITDEGFRLLLGHLLRDNYTKVLNMTGNHITEKGLVMLLKLAEENRILKTIYLTHNKVSTLHLKSKKQQLQKNELDIIL